MRTPAGTASQGLLGDESVTGAAGVGCTGTGSIFWGWGQQTAGQSEQAT